MPGAKTIRAGVIGWPVAHSLSPRLHGYWLKQYGINGSYEAIPAEPLQLEATLKRLRDEGYAGINLTVPHKEHACEWVDEISDDAKRIGAVNTIVMRDGKMIGSNTDTYGFTENLRAHNFSAAGANALVMGAGGAARAVCAALLTAGATVTLANRTYAKADAIATALGGNIRALDWDDYADAMAESSLLINTTPLGMKGQHPLTISLDSLSKDAVVTDIVYNPLITPLLAAAKVRGHKIIDGIGMLLYQAVPGFEAWFGVRPEVTAELKAHVLEGLQ